MPRIRLITNIGTVDSIRLGLGDLDRDGDVVEVSDDAAAEAIGRVWAVLVSDDDDDSSDEPPPAEPAEDQEETADADARTDGDDAPRPPRPPRQRRR